MVKNPPANAGGMRRGLIPGSGRSPGVGNSNPSQYVAWKISWTKEPSGLLVHGVTELDTAEHTHTIFTGEKTGLERLCPS